MKITLRKITYALAILTLLLSTKAGANGAIDVQVSDGDKRIAAQVRINGSWFALVDSYSTYSGVNVGIGYGWLYKTGFAVLSYNELGELQLSGTYRHPKTEWSIDGRLVDNLEKVDPRFEFGFNYHLGAGKAAIRLSYEHNKWWIGIRRTL